MVRAISGIGPSGAKNEYSQGPLVGNWIEDNVVIGLGGAGACQPFEKHWVGRPETMTQARKRLLTALCPARLALYPPQWCHDHSWSSFSAARGAPTPEASAGNGKVGRELLTFLPSFFRSLSSASADAADRPGANRSRPPPSAQQHAAGGAHGPVSRDAPPPRDRRVARQAPPARHDHPGRQHGRCVREEG